MVKTAMGYLAGGGGKRKRFTYDARDAGLVLGYRWYVIRGRSTWYVHRTATIGGKNRRIYLHREITKAPPGFDVDHINWNGLDNRRSNLRVVTRSQNLSHNRQKIGASGYRGVWKANSASRWPAYIKRNGKCRYIGSYDTPELAHEAYRRAAALHSQPAGEKG